MFVGCWLSRNPSFSQAECPSSTNDQKDNEDDELADDVGPHLRIAAIGNEVVQL